MTVEETTTTPTTVPPPTAPTATPPRRRPRTTILLAVWAALIAGAFVLDRPVAKWIATYEPIPAKRKKAPGIALAKKIGDFRYLSVAIVAAAIVHRARWRAGVMLLAAAAISAAFYGSKWVFGRHRPSHLLEPFTLHWFKDGLPGIFYAQELSFPSGHACLTFAVAGGLAALFPRWSWAFFAVCVIVGVQRVLEGAHYPSDVVAGAAFGLLSSHIALRLASGWFGPAWLLDVNEAAADQRGNEGAVDQRVIDKAAD
jgi:membrane-associated phospholipid phosphatase